MKQILTLNIHSPNQKTIILQQIHNLILILHISKHKQINLNRIIIIQMNLIFIINLFQKYLKSFFIILTLINIYLLTKK